jgi:hypothetical protein
MMTKMITEDGRVFEDPTEDAIENESFALLWDNDSYGNKDKAISPHKWELHSCTGNHFLRDATGEISHIEWGCYHAAIEYPSWKEYRNAMVRKDLAKLKEDNEELRKGVNILEISNGDQRREIGLLQGALRAVYDLTHTGGQGSRRKVETQIRSILGKNPCCYCEKYDCKCN